MAWFVYGRITAPITYPPGVLLASEPEQRTPTSEASFNYKKFQLKPLVTFVLDARVLHRKIYRYDPGAALVPVDLAVGWGPMSDQAVLDHLKISQSARFYFYEYPNQPPIPREGDHLALDQPPSHPVDRLDRFPVQIAPHRRADSSFRLAR